MLRERVEDAVEGLVRHALALVAAALEDEGAVGAAQLGDEAIDEGGLADARAAADVHAHRRAGDGELERVAHGRQQIVAADEARAALGRAERGLAERLADVGAAEPRRRVAPQQAHAQGRQLRIDVGRDLLRRGRSSCCLAWRICSGGPVNGRRPVSAS